MRIVATTICALTLAGCASSNLLPYSIAIGNLDKPRDGPGHTECLLRLDKIVKNIALNYSSAKLHNVKSVQVEFEKQLRHGTQTTQTKYGTPPVEIPPLEDRPPLEKCKDGKQEHEKDNFSFFKKDDYPFIEEISKKSLTTYALDATDPDQDLDRFREYLRSAQLVEQLAAPNKPLPPEEEEEGWVEEQKQSPSLSL